MVTPCASERASEPVELTEDHVALVWLLARRLVGRNGIARIVGVEELVSEGLVILVVLSQEFDPELGVPFEAFVRMRLPNKLIDHLRQTYGRVTRHGEVPRKMRITLMTSSLDDHFTDDENKELPDERLIDPSPPMEEQVESRMQLEQLFRFAEEELTSRHQEALLWPLWRVRAPGGRPVPNKRRTRWQEAAGARAYAKQRAYEAIGRPVFKQGYRKKQVV